MWPWNASTVGEVYLFHFHQPLGNLSNRRAQARHYLGFTDDFEKRLARQAAGKGAKIVAAAVAHGITFTVYHWPASLAVEKLVKRTKKTSLYCPACCAAAGRKVRALPIPAIQLALPFDEELPEIELGSLDWLEMKIQQDWRQARIPAPVDIHAIDDLL